MSLMGIGLLVCAGLLHAGWNLLLKRSQEQLLVLWWAFALCALCALPPLIAAPPAPALWPYALASAGLEALYLLLLASAYRRADFSLVYPVARGTAPALLALWSSLYLGERLRPPGLLGLALIMAGVFVIARAGTDTRQRTCSRHPAALGTGVPTPVGLTNGLALMGSDGPTAKAGAEPGTQNGVPGVPNAVGRAGQPRIQQSLGALISALLIGLLISLYSAVDAAAVRLGPPLPYTLLIFSLTAPLSLPLLLARFGWAGLLVGGWQARWRALAVGALMLLTYLLVLVVYAREPAGYAGAVRELSIVFGALAGWLWLGEGFGPARLAGSLMMLGGVLLIALAG